MYQHRTSDLDLAGATGKAHEVGGEVLIDDAPEVSSATQITRDGITLRGASGTGSVNVEGGTKTALYVWRPQTDFPVVLVNAQHTRLIDLPIVIREPRPGSFAVLVGGSDYVGELGMTNCYLASSPASSMEGYGLGVFRGLKGTLVDCWIGGWKYGVRLKDWGNAGYPANAWTLTGCSILWCDTGLSIETGWANVQGGTIEGNNVGVRCLDGHLVLNAVHLENKAANLVAQDGGSIVARDCRITVAGVGVWVREGGRFVGHGGHYAGGQLRNETTDPTRLRLVDPTFSKNSSIVGPHVIEGTARWE